MTTLQYFQMLAAMSDDEFIVHAASLVFTQKPGAEEISDFRSRVVQSLIGETAEAEA